jgi:hypothetical protein
MLGKGDWSNERSGWLTQRLGELELVQLEVGKTIQEQGLVCSLCALALQLPLLGTDQR